MSISSSAVLLHDSPSDGTDGSDIGVRVFGPASLSNLGPGFDTLGLCIEGVGDMITARRTDRPGVMIEAIGGDDGALPLDAKKNTASVAAEHVLRQHGATFGIAMQIEKSVPCGSGIGGSSASAVAGAWAANLLMDRPLPKKDLITAVLEGEAIASGSLHGDNVVPALLGGLVLVSSSEPTHYRQIELPAAVHIAILLPEVEVLTREAREILPTDVSLRSAVHNASALAFLVDAFRSGDWEQVGKSIMEDGIIEPVRARLVPCYQAVRGAALEAGAYGCALTGSGPAMFAIAHNEQRAQDVAYAMREACLTAGIEAKAFATRSNEQGAHAVY
jgi:homoserine kinase